MNDGEERELTYGVSQEIPFPGKLQLRGEVASREAERLEQEYLAVPLRVIARLKEAFYDLAFVHTSIEIVEKNRLATWTSPRLPRHGMPWAEACSRMSSGRKQRSPACWRVWRRWNNARSPCMQTSTVC